jgi:hypothetical protein
VWPTQAWGSLCYDNPVMEAFFSPLKTEVADRFDSCGDAKMEYRSVNEMACTLVSYPIQCRYRPC